MGHLLDLQLQLVSLFVYFVDLLLVLGFELLLALLMRQSFLLQLLLHTLSGFLLDEFQLLAKHLFFLFELLALLLKAGHLVLKLTLLGSHRRQTPFHLVSSVWALFLSSLHQFVLHLDLW